MYDGFISYSHAADGRLAPRLQAGLQRFAKPWWRRRALRIFRDESSLAANPHLWSSITEALDSSEWFVLLLSPDAAQSEWVNQEIAYWLENRDPARVIPVVTAGEFGWDGSEVSGDSVPPSLRGVFESEPRWVDARSLGDPATLDLKNREFVAVVADLAAPLRGIAKDELTGEEVRQYRRTVRTAWAVGALLLVLAVAASWAGVRSAQNAEVAAQRAEEAEEQRQSAEEARIEAETQEQLALDEAGRADETARRLIDLTLDFEGSEVQPPGVVPERTPPLEVLEPLSEPPDSPRLDFLQVQVQGEVRERLGHFVDYEAGVRSRYYLGGATLNRTLWHAHEPFHVRHGFAGIGQSIEQMRDAGFQMKLYVTKEVGPHDQRFEEGVTELNYATAALSSVEESCGPDPDQPVDGPCEQWVFDFPEGLPPGVFHFWLEWLAPCEEWWERDVCRSPTRQASFLRGISTVSFLSESYQSAGLNLPEWPINLWHNAEPLP